MSTPQDRPGAALPEAPRKSVLSVLGKWLLGLLLVWIYPVGPILGLIILAVADGLQKQHPALSDLLLVFALASCFAHIGLGWWLGRDLLKDRDARAAARANEQAEFIQVMQEVSYWLDGTTTTEEPLGAITAELMTIAHHLARKRVEQEIYNKGFKTRDVSLSEIKSAARALMSAQRPKKIEQARARLEQMKAHRPNA